MTNMRTKAVKYIENSPYALLITVGEENIPCSRYIGPIVNIGLDIYFVTRIDSRKVKDIAIHPFVSAVFQKPDQEMKTFQTITINGKAERVPDGDEFNGVLEKLGQISAGYKAYISSGGFTTWTIYKITAKSWETTDLANSTKPYKEEL